MIPQMAVVVDLTRSEDELSPLLAVTQILGASVLFCFAFSLQNP